MLSELVNYDVTVSAGEFLFPATALFCELFQCLINCQLINIHGAKVFQPVMSSPQLFIVLITLCKLCFSATRISCLSLITQVQAFSFIWSARDALQQPEQAQVIFSTAKSVATLWLFTYLKARISMQCSNTQKCHLFSCLMRSYSQTTQFAEYWRHGLIPAVSDTFSLVWLGFLLYVRKPVCQNPESWHMASRRTGLWRASLLGHAIECHLSLGHFWIDEQRKMKWLGGCQASVSPTQFCGHWLHGQLENWSYNLRLCLCLVKFPP